MRLLNTKTLLLEAFTDHRAAPRYAILSHTWEDDEVLFEDVYKQDPSIWKGKTGAGKVRSSCRQALKDRYDYIWIDTCCIDKSSSAELSEAINSMFIWYEAASVCYAYLSDSTGAYKNCLWFTRGWTLQELIAPGDVKFFDKYWKLFGTREHDAVTISKLTGIDDRLLSRTYSNMYGPLQDVLRTVSVATRMFWASKRSTTRVEDVAYCLMGIFNINMPLLYGEGNKAFRRLQEEILKSSGDDSILAFDDTLNSILADHPEDFRHDLVLTHQIGMPRTIRVNRDTITLDALICPLDIEGLPNFGLEFHLLLLNCRYATDYLTVPAIILLRMETEIFGESFESLSTPQGVSGFFQKVSGIHRLEPNTCSIQTGLGAYFGQGDYATVTPKLSEAKVRKITIAGLGSVESLAQVPFAPLLRIRSLEQDDDMEFRLSRSIHLTFKQGASDDQKLGYHGLVLFHDESSNLPKKADNSIERPWCGVWRSDDPRIQQYLRALRIEAHSPWSQLSQILDHFEQRYSCSSLGATFLPDTLLPPQLSHKTSRRIGESLSVAAEILSEQFLGHRVFYLDIKIRKAT
ncbi:heterokaryon incompatibility protein-domain-containing protein [Xylariales sp. AK1849]|nr:heterokaryon incompatibility protein-domain-containing protein [Xylariales sp. AK1849]